MYNELERIIFGKNNLQNVVSIESNDSYSEIFQEIDNRLVITTVPNKKWLLFPNKAGNPFSNYLLGDQYFNQLQFCDNDREFYQLRKNYPDHSCISDPKEAFMVLNGYTYYKGMKFDDVSVLSFDIEATTLDPRDKNAKVLLISNTFKSKRGIIKKLFAYDEYHSNHEMIRDWCTWVREMNPSVITGFNVFSYDLPYLDQRSENGLHLGRDCSKLKFNSYESDFRRDGSQSYKYKRCFIYGREIIDSMFLAYHFDFSRKYDSYGLKNIIKQEGLEKVDRQHYDASKIAENYLKPDEWKKIKEYAKDDADDALTLYSLMAPQYFYLTQSIPKSFQQINCTATGSQINSLMMRSYLQEGYSIPKKSEGTEFGGGISLGNPGVYSNVLKADIASLYPSIMLEYNVYDKDKDPHRNFQKMLKYFTEERLNNKQLAKKTNDRYYKELQESQKTVINSAYGMLGAPGLTYNSLSNASFVTAKGREILEKAIAWANTKGFLIPNGDTDSISFCKQNGEQFTEKEQNDLLEELNSLYPKRIHWEHDGIFEKMLILKAKNYVTFDGKKKKIKGSALKDTKRELALREFSNNTCDNLMFGKKDQILIEYNMIAKEIMNLKDVSRWSFKRTVTESVLNPERLNEQKILDALEHEDLQAGTKHWFYFKNDEQESLGLTKDWKDDHSRDRMLEKLHKTIKIFHSVLDVKQFPNYKLKRSKKLLEVL